MDLYELIDGEWVKVAKAPIADLPGLLEDAPGEDDGPPDDGSA